MQHEYKGPLAISMGFNNSSISLPQMFMHKADNRQAKSELFARGVHITEANNPVNELDYGALNKTSSPTSSFSPPQSSVTDSRESIQRNDRVPCIAGSFSSVGNRSMKNALEELESALLGPDGESVECAGDNNSFWTELLDEVTLTTQPTTTSCLSHTQPLAMPQGFQQGFCRFPNVSNVGRALGSGIGSEENRAKILLVTCAVAIAENRMDRADALLSELRKEVSIFGDPVRRLAAYMCEGLVARMQASGFALYRLLKCMEVPAAQGLSAMQKMYEICPYFKFAYMAANGAIAEAFKNESKVHIFDFQIGQGTQWISLMQGLANRPGGPPCMRITTLEDPCVQGYPIGGMQLVQQRLTALAETLKVPFEFNAIPCKLCELKADMIERRMGEALAVNFALQLHHLPDESVCVENPRDRTIRIARGLNPKVMTVVEQEANTNTTPFLTRFIEVLEYYTCVFESIDVVLPRESKDRVNVEEQCLARDIVNVIACEGADRVERHELTGKWRARMNMAGFRPHPLSSYVNDTIRMLLQSYSDKYTLKDEGGALFLGWCNRPLVVASAWQ